MNRGQFEVHTTPGFDRLLKKLAAAHPNELQGVFAQVIDVLRVDPYNRTRRHLIKKLEDVSVGEGQYRLRVRRYRFRYDIRKQIVVLMYCGLRREDTY
jgi:mRNA-degrading endonuclease RelE of RelBE toxin-antitoxin system